MAAQRARLIVFWTAAFDWLDPHHGLVTPRPRRDQAVPPPGYWGGLLAHHKNQRRNGTWAAAPALGTPRSVRAADPSPRPLGV